MTTNRRTVFQELTWAAKWYGLLFVGFLILIVLLLASDWVWRNW